MLKIFDPKLPYLKYVVWTLRIAIGATFILSGIAKVIDLWGFVYKIEQYLNVWGVPPLRTIVFMTALAISAVEFIVGVMLATGSYKRLSVYIASLLMLVMLPLSVYIVIADPVEDCGCFG
ncbi:MAG: DoxX family membrane protein, partial [Muribaculaceae bacterium]|nr:DoxX family membrane protein [Muribaculaceae bacterium]